MSTKATQRNVTRNQSTVDFTNSCLFTFDNRFEEANFKAAAAITIQDGMLVTRNVTDGNVSIATAATLEDVIGVLKVCGSVTLAAGEEIPVNVCTKGSIDSTLLVLPATVTLKTTVGKKFLVDVLNGIGLTLDNYTEITFTDN